MIFLRNRFKMFFLLGDILLRSFQKDYNYNVHVL